MYVGADEKKEYILTGRDTITSVNGRYGQIFFPQSDDIIANSLREYGEWAQCEIDVLLRFIARGDVVLDGGACFGTHSRAFSSKVGSAGKVLSFEPSPNNFPILKRNASVAKSGNINIFQLALGAAEGSAISFEVDSENLGASKVRVLDAEVADQQSLVQVTTIDALNLERLDFIKLDLEGEELSALTGATQTLKRLRPIVFTETNNIEESAHVFLFMKDMGYFCFGVNSAAFNPENFAGSKHDMLPGASENGFLFIHSSASAMFGPRIDELRLPTIETLDDIVLLMLHQKQYPAAVLQNSASAQSLDVPHVVTRAEVPAQVDVAHDQIAAQVDDLIRAYEKKLQDAEADYTSALQVRADEQSEVEQRLRAEKKRNADHIAQIGAEFLALRDDCARTIELHKDAIKLSKKVTRLPFSIFFKVSKKYRRLTRRISRSSDLPDQIRARLQSIQSLLNINHSIASPPADLKDVIRPHFDADFYLATYPGIREAKLDPLDHYISHGWKEGRDPNSEFSTSFYLAMNTDVATAGVNPFWHYITVGKQEGRAIRHPGGHLADRLHKNQLLEKDVVSWGRGSYAGVLLGEEKLVEILDGLIVEGRDRFVISIGQDNYRQNSGGVQFCIQKEELISADYNSNYLNLSPWQSLPRLAHIEDEPDPVMVLVANGEEIGACRISDVIKSVSAMRVRASDIKVVVHHLLGHCPEHVASLVEATGRKDCWLWLHDFFTICPSYTLLRNSVVYCGAPDISSNACTLCKFGVERHEHSKRIRAFFAAVDVHILSPSQVTLDLWRERSNLTAASQQVVPHMQLSWKTRDNALPVSDRPITIGFIGAPVPHKGWDVFVSLVKRYGANRRFRFVILGLSASPIGGVHHAKAHTTGENPVAMIEAIKAEQCDFILHWALWPETFSLATFEAFSAGAYVITNTVSGNVAAAVRTYETGVVLENEDELARFFESSDLADLSVAARKRRSQNEVSHRFSRMTYDVFDGTKQ
ncbi:FkbM family methyltransferase [Agrobacterium vitis]|nr:FkbM family methyltransferase [Agrobacterium vitis]